MGAVGQRALQGLRLAATTPYDAYERHALTARFLRRALEDQPATVLDVGGRAALLSRYVPYRVVAVNPDLTGDVVGSGTALPVADGCCAAAVSLDTLEHLPRAARADLVRECLRVAGQVVVLAAPLGGALHNRSEIELDELYRRVNGTPHPYLAEHIRYGLPTVDDLAAWRSLPGVAASDLYFAGDFTWQARSFARAIRAAELPRNAARLVRGWHQLSSLALWHPLAVQTAPRPTTNRFYLVLHKAHVRTEPTAHAAPQAH